MRRRIIGTAGASEHGHRLADAPAGAGHERHEVGGVLVDAFAGEQERVQLGEPQALRWGLLPLGEFGLLARVVRHQVAGACRSPAVDLVEDGVPVGDRLRRQGLPGGGAWVEAHPVDPRLHVALVDVCGFAVPEPGFDPAVVVAPVAAQDVGGDVAFLGREPPLRELVEGDALLDVGFVLEVAQGALGSEVVDHPHEPFGGVSVLEGAGGLLLAHAEQDGVPGGSVGARARLDAGHQSSSPRMVIPPSRMTPAQPVPYSVRSA
jgi:hypothetical protein